MLTYLAGPIDYVDDAEGIKNWGNTASVMLGGHDLATYNPAGAFSANAAMCPQALKDVNIAALLASDGVLACVMPTVASWGTPIEIEMATQSGLPIVLWTPTDEPLPPYLQHLPACRTLRSAVETLAERMCSGPKSDGQQGLMASNTGIQVPAKKGDVGYDLYVLQDQFLQPGKLSRVAVGNCRGSDILRLALPPDTWATIYGRSSMVSSGLIVLQTVIDEGYRGPIYTMVYNPGPDHHRVEAGSRISQLVLMRSVVAEVEWVGSKDALPASERGESGFGSTGK